MGTMMVFQYLLKDCLSEIYFSDVGILMALLWASDFCDI